MFAVRGESGHERQDISDLLPGAVGKFNEFNAHIIKKTFLDDRAPALATPDDPAAAAKRFLGDIEGKFRFAAVRQLLAQNGNGGINNIVRT